MTTFQHYTQTYICSRRRSGKTTLIYNILKHIVNKRTNVVFCCSTIHRDTTSKLILEMLEKRAINVMTYDHFLNGKENILTGIIEELNNDLEAKEQEKI